LPVDRLSRLAALVFFAALLVVGLLVYRDYGTSWDEAAMRETVGIVNYRYVTGADRQALNDPRRAAESYHGPAFELLLMFLEKRLGLPDIRQVYLMRHLMTFLFFYAAVVCFYRLARRRFESGWLALAGSAMLVLSPRIFADAFYNVKDLVFLSAYVVSLWSLDFFYERRTWAAAALHGFWSAVAIDIRVMAVLIPLLTVMLFVADRALGRSPSTEPARQTPHPLWVYAIGVTVFTVLLWPRLWENPPYHLFRALVDNGRFPWNNTMLFRGLELNGANVPPTYIPVWIGITTPIAYLLLFAVGLTETLRSLIQDPAGTLRQRPLDYLVLIAGLAPLAAVIVLHSTVYDGWRHLYFIYPPLLLLAVNGLAWLGRQAPDRWRWAVVAAVVLSFASTAYTMVRHHPYQNLYFNRLAGPSMQSIKSRFELDYWGLTYRKGLEYVLAQHPGGRPVVSVANAAGVVPVLLLPPEDRARLLFAGQPADADYFITNYRWHPQDYRLSGEVFSVWYDDAKILSVFRRPFPPGPASEF
jgi:Dolichyl-phosphate-mannose-protein mannosyltransferase